MITRSDEFYMSKAIEQAVKAYKKDEVPIGVVITYEGKIIAQAHNQVESLNDSTAHAEIIAITQASQYLKDWRLNDCVIYLTKEPCLMCLGALYNSRIKKLVIALSDEKFGALQFFKKEQKIFHHQFQIKKGILKEESFLLLKKFFQEKRKSFL